MNRNAIEALARARHLRMIRPQASTARRLWAKADKDLATARHLVPIDADRAQECAYDAVYKAVLGILCLLGYRVVPVRQRVTGVEALRAILDDPAHQELVDSFNDMREKRNQVAYEAGEASETEASQAIGDAERLLTSLRSVFETLPK